MLGSGARCPRLRRPPALALPPPPPSPRRRPAPPGQSRDQRAGDGPALPAGSRGLRGGGPAGGRRGRGLEGRDAGTGRARAARPQLHCGAGGGQSRGPARCGEGGSGRPSVAGHLRQVAARLGETWASEARTQRRRHGDEEEGYQGLGPEHPR
ncbi:translation initiation factor IF-2-like isoform X3 [Acinonyx jubatus]|uniref:Translation initiation factor IF-2-like isoform X3 n=1 Tax=Acinonyx jubatus TaxID=32536 RepID=A0ABM3PHW6_ACIJB|nr:translation initiation factor IF-2-like isoform X3 [Acinonyx jubatus]